LPAPKKRTTVQLSTIAAANKPDNASNASDDSLA